MNGSGWGPQGAGEPGLVKPGAATALGASNSCPQWLRTAPWGNGDGLFKAMQGRRIRRNKEKLKQQSFSLAIRRKIFPMRTVRYADYAVFGDSPDTAGGSQITELICCKQKTKAVASWGHSQSELSHGPVTFVEWCLQSWAMPWHI